MDIRLAFTHHTLVPVRKEASDPSEMITQLLFGDLIHVLESHKQWRKIRILDDGYEGWIDHKMIEPIVDEWQSEIDSWKFIFDPTVSTRSSFKGQLSKLHLTLGCRIPVPQDWESQPAIVVKAGDFRAHLSPKNLCAYTKPERKSVLENGMRYLGSPYLWGGKSLWGIDCSGLTQMVFKLSELPSLKRDAWQQADQGKAISWSEKQPGDLAFFTNAKGKVIHVGILLEEGKILHASGRVRVDSLTEKGIIHAENGELTHQLSSLRSYI